VTSTITLEEITDRLAIRELIDAYAHSADRRDASGQMVLANPDFVARLKTAAPLNAADRASFFGGAAQGYTDYPAREAATAA
jgi:2,4-dienoyl-CoA reductase-like NADH-dependent reductase (Old Yellow Enzyme family)